MSRHDLSVFVCNGSSGHSFTFFWGPRYGWIPFVLGSGPELLCELSFQLSPYTWLYLYGLEGDPGQGWVGTCSWGPFIPMISPIP